MFCFDDVLFIVFDEVYYCNKDYFYNVIIRDFYFWEDDLFGYWLKVLGLIVFLVGELFLDKIIKWL